MKHKVIDCHAHIFPPAAGASGFPDAATHLLHQQRAMHLHGNQPYRRKRDDAKVTDRPLWDASNPSEAGRKTDVKFRVGKFGRFEWTVNHEDYYVQFLPPWMDDLSMSADRLVAMMDYAGIGAALLQNDHIYGNLGEFFAEAAKAHPGRFVITAQVEEAFAYKDAELKKLEDQINRLHAGAIYFTTTGMFRSGYKPMHSDHVYDPFWKAVEKSGLPVCWVQSTDSPVGKYDDELKHMEKIIERFPKIHHVLVHGIPTAIYADEHDKLKLSPILLALMKSGHVSAEILYPIAWGGKYEYPYARAQLHTRQLVETFGVDRFVWGTDEPNVERYCTYGQALDYFTMHSQYLNDAQRQAILYDNALKLYPAFKKLAEVGK